MNRTEFERDIKSIYEVVNSIPHIDYDETMVEFGIWRVCVTVTAHGMPTIRLTSIVNALQDDMRADFGYLITKAKSDLYERVAKTATLQMASRILP